MNADVAKAIGSGYTRRTLSSTSKREVVREAWVSESYTVDDLLAWLCHADRYGTLEDFGRFAHNGTFYVDFWASDDDLRLTAAPTLLEALEQAVLAVSS